MTVLGDLIHVTAGFRRSVHVERDAGRPLGEAYIPTTRAVHTLRRVTEAMVDDTRGRAWSITGPYGTGKSSFALFLDALPGPPGPVREATTTTLAATDADLSRRLEIGRARLHPTGEFIRAVATSRREPVTTTIIRAMRHGAERRWPSGIPIEVARALRRAEKAVDVGAVLECVRRLSGHGPVLILIDEFGKNLEYLADDPAGGDLFILQELPSRPPVTRPTPCSSSPCNTWPTPTTPQPRHCDPPLGESGARSRVASRTSRSSTAPNRPAG